MTKQSLKEKIAQSKYLSPLLFVVMSLIISAVGGVALMYAAYSLPNGRIEEHVRESLPMWSKEDPSYEYWARWDHTSRLDMSTDASMLRAAVYVPEGSKLKAAMLNILPNYIAPNSTGEAEQWQFSSFDNLKQYLTQENEELQPFFYNYCRYWHGYLTVLRPLLEIFNYSQIRTFNVSVLTLLLGITICLINKKAGLLPTAAFLGAVAIINPVSAALSMQYVNSFGLMLIGTMAVFGFELYKKKGAWKLFLWLGIGCAFFDFLTYPLVTLGIPLLFYLYMKSKESLKESFLQTIGCSLSWGIGYGGMWASKWIVGSLITGENLIANGLERAVMRTSGGDDIGEVFSFFDTLTDNFTVAFSKTNIVFLALLGLLMIGLLVYKKSKFKWNPTVLSMAFIGIYPVLWYAVLINHSARHFWMTHRLFSISVLAGGLILCTLFQSKTKPAPVIQSDCDSKDSDQSLEFSQTA